MAHPILGLHHVTATADDAQQDLDFYLGALGLRLVKKTVNFDNHNVYHFYYGNESGTPGTIWTTFPYKGWGVPVGRKGTGQIRATSFSVPAGSLDRWKTRLEERNVAVQESERFGEASIAFTDPSGLITEIVGSAQDARRPWTANGVDEADAIRGLHSVTLLVRSPKETVDFMKDLLGFEVVDERPGRIRVAVNGDDAGKLIDVASDPSAQPAVNGLGTVHHVAMAIAEPDEQLRLRDDLLRRGSRVTEVRDRQYFLSIYFREPGGVLFEVATTGPGFAIDEDLGSLGRDLKLPPWEEPHRAEIVTRLPTVAYAGGR
jgi:glyoxalase family protein